MSTEPIEQPTAPEQVAEPSAPIEAITESAPAEEVAPAEPQKTEPEKQLDEKFASKFAALSRKEKEVRKRENAAAQREKQLEARLKEMEDRIKASEQFDELIKKDPLTELEKRGLSYKDLTEKFILKGEPTPEEKQMSIMQQLQSKIDALESKLKKDEEDAKQKAEAQQRENEEKAKTNYINHLTEFVNKNADKYELIAKNEAYQVVYDVIEAHYNETLQESGEGQVLTESEAADAVEEYLLEEAKKLIEANKIKTLVGPQSPKNEPKKSPGQSATLSNTLSQQVPAKTEKFLSDSESKRQVASMLKWTE